jgi:MFS family permease
MTTTIVDAPARPGEHRDFRLYLAGDVSSTFGSVFTATATSVLAVDMFHASGFQAGVLAAASTLPTLVLAPVAGALADRIRRPRRVLIIGELVAAVAVGICAAGVAAGVAHFFWLVLVTVALGAVLTVTQTVFFTHLNSLRRAHLATARARLQTASYVASSSANAVAGPVIGVFGPALALATDAVSYLLSAGSLRAIRSPDRNPAYDPGRVPQAIHRDIVAGVRILARSRLRSVIGYALLGQLGFAGTGALKALFLLRTLDVPPHLYGVPGFCAAALGVVGSLVASRALAAGRRPGHVTVAWWTCGAFVALLLPVTAGPLPVVLLTAATGLAVPAMCGAAANVALVALFSDEIPEDAMGRANASLMVVVTAVTAAGALLAGGAADLLGVRGALWLCVLAGVAGLPLLRPLLRGGRSVPRP